MLVVLIITCHDKSEKYYDNEKKKKNIMENIYTVMVSQKNVMIMIKS